MAEQDAAVTLAAAEAQHSVEFQQGTDDARMLVNVARSLGAERRRQGIPITTVAAEMRTSVRAVEDLAAAMNSAARQIANAQQRAAGCIVSGVDTSGVIAWLAEAEKSLAGAQEWLADPPGRGGDRG